jgi:hypothetical protein
MVQKRDPIFTKISQVKKTQIHRMIIILQSRAGAPARPITVCLGRRERWLWSVVCGHQCCPSAAMAKKRDEDGPFIVTVVILAMSDER